MTVIPAGPADERADSVAIGVLGLGTAGRQAVRAVEASRSVRLVAVCDRDAATAERIGGTYGVVRHTDVSTLCDDTAVEAVYVATPTFLHHEHVAYAIGCGKHVLVEKPIAASTEEAGDLVRLSAATDRVVLAVNTRGRDAPVTQLGRCVRQGRIGRLLNVTTVWQTNWLLRPRFSYEVDPLRGGGIVFRQAPHQVEMVREIAGGSVTAVTAVTHEVSVPLPAVGQYAVVAELAGGASGLMSYNGCGFLDSGLLTFGIGEGGRVDAGTANAAWRRAQSWRMDKYSEVGLQFRGSSVGAGAGPWGFSGLTIVNGERGDLRQTPDGILVYGLEGTEHVPADTTEPSGLAADFEELWAAVRTGAVPTHDCRWGAETVAVCEAIWRSSQRHERTPIDLDAIFGTSNEAASVGVAGAGEPDR